VRHYGQEAIAADGIARSLYGNARGDLSARVCKVSGVESTSRDGPYITPLAPDGHPAGLGSGVAFLTSRSRAARELLRAYDDGGEASVSFEVSDAHGSVRRCVVQGVPLHHLLEQSLGDDPDRWPEPDVLHYATEQSAEK